MKTPLDSVHRFAAFLARHSAIIALALFAVVGVAVLDDYGIAVDENWQRNIGIDSFDYILGDGDEDALRGGIDRFYGVAFEVPLIAVERALGLEDSRDIHLSRHLLTHAFFLAGGFFAWLLAYRLFGSRLIALLAMLIFLLHPRIYAHSFFNSKDVPFLSMFMIALYLIHRAFRRDTVWAFALCGAGVGLLANIRIMGVMLIPAVLGMLALDAFYAMKSGKVKHILANICAFSTVCVATLYVTWPALWRDPLGIAETLATMSSHPELVVTLFRGELVQWPNIPWDYIPTWALITTPPAALLLAALGIGYLARICAADWRGALSNSRARFGLLTLACLILPVAAVIALNSNVYSGWRHAYFLYAPICVLAAFGLRWLAALPKPGVRGAALSLAAVGIAAAAIPTVSLHPYQHEYFGPLVNKSGIADRWGMNHWRAPYREALETLLEMQPSGRVAIAADEPWRVGWNIEIIPPDERRRLGINSRFPSFRVIRGDGGDGAVWTREFYGAPMVSLVDVRAETEAAFQDIYAAARASEPAASGGGFDVYADGDTLTYVKDGCGEEDARSRFPLFAFPVEQSGLPGSMRDAGYEYAPLDDSDFLRHGAMYDGKCVIVRDLPHYPISYVETGQFTPGESRAWSATIPLAGYRERYERALSRLSGEPAAQSGFNIWLDGRELTYVKENCDGEDTRGRFFLSIFPSDLDDLPQSARDAGREHESLNFDFARYGALLDGKCVIIRYLPDYAISRIETGQWLPGEGELWRAAVENLTQ